MSTRYVRVTVAAQHRNVEMLLPAERQLGEMMPEILRTTGPPVNAFAPEALALTPVGAGTIRPQQSLDDAGVGNGAVLSLDRRDEAVPRPVVYDLAEETERMAGMDRDHLSVDLGRLISIAVFTVFGVAGLVMAVQVFSVESPGRWALATSGAALLGMAVIPRARLAWDLELFFLSVVSLTLSYRWGFPEFVWSEWSLPVWAFALILAWLIAGRLWLGVLASFVSGAVLFLLWWAPAQLLTEHDQIVAVAAAGTVVLLGLTPRTALMLSGMNRLDDELAQGQRPSVPQARRAFADAHAGLVGSVLLCGISSVIAVYGLVSEGFTRWSLPIAIAVTLLTGLRARSMPLALEKAALLSSSAGSAIIILSAAAGHIPGWVLILTPCLLALVPLLLRVVSVPEHIAAQLRINARRLEALSTLALIPLILGLFGLYAQLVDTFQD